MSPAEIASNAIAAYEQGNKDAAATLLSLQKELFAKISFGKARPDSLCYCTYNLLGEWIAIYNSEVSIPKGIEAIEKLFLWIIQHEKPETKQLFQQTEWAQLVRLRGPVEAICHCKCNDCGREFLTMASGDFSDERGWICSKCGSVIFRSIYNSGIAPSCECGGKTFSNCPACASRKYKILKTSSPYGYFSNHRWQRLN